ncbi:glycosyltransferase family 1 protein [Methanofollis formosanus]|uniref:Glycosyltransferase family 1 protein n=1 Tax=Methanofollis formosanus TaxID=299308 RepID=A0A8G1A4N1_9EURY|nr:glycosyltransferase family 4 protein [Methanofollis formosanus]QYZ80373.1 glycosyltransferase family 1 protein [Methanofollis formosanus]
MKITILVSLFPPKWLAGTEIATYYMAGHLAQRGHEVHVITSWDEDLPKESYEKDFYIHRLPRVRVRFVGAFIFWADIVRTIQKISPDIVHVQSLGIAFPAVISKKILRIPYVVWGQGSDVYLPDWFTKLTSKTIIKNADVAIALTSNMKEAMKNIYNRNMAVVPNGIELEGYIDKSPMQKVKCREKIVLFVGRLHPIKGVRYLLLAMQILHEEMPDTRLILVGDGEERNYLEELTDRLEMRGWVDFVGKVPHQRIPDYMCKADIFVLPSLSESFGIVNIEAMAFGLPVVATRVGGLPDIIEEGVNGYLVEAKKPDQIAHKLLILLQNNTIMEEISINNIRKAEMFTWDKVTETIEGIYLDCLNNRPCRIRNEAKARLRHTE